MHKFKNRGKLAVSSPGESVVGGYTLAGSWLDRGAGLHISISLSLHLSHFVQYLKYMVLQRRSGTEFFQISKTNKTLRKNQIVTQKPLSKP